VIEEVISKKAPFQLISEQLKDIPKLSSPTKLYRPAFNARQESKKKERREKNRELVKQFVDSNGLNGVLLVNCAHSVSGYIVYKVTLRTYWILYDYDGREVFEMRTKYKSEESKAFANTLDPRYEATFLKFVKMSTNDFIAMLMKNK